MSAIDDLITRIRSQDDAVRTAAWEEAGQMGAPAVPSLAALIASPEPETGRAAKRALSHIVRHAGRPGAAGEAQAVAAELAALLPGGAPAVRREALWLLSEIGGEGVVASMAALLADPELREDARCALMRLPGAGVTSAFKSAFDRAPAGFKPALADSLRKRGVPVDGFPSQKRVPKVR